MLSLHKLYAEYTPEELLLAAKHYGWTPETPESFSKAIIVQFDDKPQIEICPRCRGIWPLDLDKQKEFYVPDPVECDDSSVHQ